MSKNFLVDAGGTLPTSLVAYWKLDEASGTRIDLVGSNNLSDNNTVTQALGKIGNAGQFTRANSEYLDIADNAALSMGDIDFSVAVWVYADTLPITADVIGKWDQANSKREYRLRYVGGGTTRFIFAVSNNGSAETEVTANNLGAPSTATWYFIVCWHDATANTVNIQINNGTADSAAHTTGVFDSDSRFALGASVSSGSPINIWDGRIDEAGVWKKVLSTQEKTDLYNGGAGNTLVGAFYPDQYCTLTTNLIASWNLDEASGIRVDAFGENHLTDNNTVTQAVGKVGSAAQFTAANSEYLSHTDNATLSTGDIDFTWVCWVYMDSKTDDMYILDKESATAGEYTLRYDGGEDRFLFLIRNSTGGNIGQVSANNLGSPSTGTWYFIAAWHDSVADTVNIQVNNGAVDSVATSGTISDTATDFVLGRNNFNGTKYFNGRIDEVVFWKRLLTSLEKTNLYNLGNGNTYNTSGSCVPIRSKSMMALFD